MATRIGINGFGRIGRNFGVRIAPVDVPWAHAPIDVDNPDSLAFSERLLRQWREQDH